MRCPKCHSEKIKQITFTYPRVYRCMECGFTFLVTPNPLIDEGV